MAATRKAEVLLVAGRALAISNPDKVLFQGPKHTRLDLARYYIEVAEGALRGAGGRPNMQAAEPPRVQPSKRGKGVSRS